MSAMRRVLKFLYPYWREAILAMILLALVVVADLSIPRLVQVIIDRGIANNDMRLIFTTSLIMISASIISALLAIGNTLFSVRAAQRFAADVRRSLFQKIQSLSFGNLDDFRTGQLLVRLTSDVNQLQMLVMMSLRIFTRAPLMLVGSIGLMIATNRELAMLMLLLLPLILVLTVIFVRVAQPLFLGVQKKLENLNQVLQENLSGIRVVKAFVRRNFESERFGVANSELMDQSIKVAKILSVLFPTMFLLLNVGTVAVVYFGGVQVVTGSMTVGEIMAFINYLLTTMFPVLMLSMMAGQISAANVSAGRVMEVLDSTPDVRDMEGAVTLDAMKGRVVFEDVCFNYGDDCGEPVLHDINLVAEPGETVAILGSTGSGKSSLVNLIPRFYDVTEGRVTIDGIDVRKITKTSLRSHIGVSLQESILFSGTIRDNVSYGRSGVSEAEIIAAATVAQAHDFILGFPDGYDSLVGQRGANLSGGQKQRIAIARALLVQPKILILDDSTSSVDVETEARIQEDLEKLMEDTTCFVIAQRISTVLNADKIIVLDRGEIVAEGEHRELMEVSHIYREIYFSQLGG